MLLAESHPYLQCISTTVFNVLYLLIVKPIALRTRLKRGFPHYVSVNYATFRKGKRMQSFIE